MKKKLIAVLALVLSVVMLTMTVTPAFAATTAATPWSNFPVQKRWSYTGNYTYAIQTVLYYYDKVYASAIGTIDNKFGPGTQAAVEIFQKNKGLKTDMQVGPETWGALYGCLVEDVEPPYPVAPASTDAVRFTYYKVWGSGKVLFSHETVHDTWSVLINYDKADQQWVKFYTGN